MAHPNGPNLTHQSEEVVTTAVNHLAASDHPPHPHQCLDHAQCPSPCHALDPCPNLPHLPMDADHNAVPCAINPQLVAEEPHSMATLWCVTETGLSQVITKDYTEDMETIIPCMVV